MTKSATVSLQSNTYQVDPLLVGKRVKLVYDPFDLTGLITVPAGNGGPAGIAVLSEIRRHVHKKAATDAADDSDIGAKTAVSGIDYLRLGRDPAQGYDGRRADQLPQSLNTDAPTGCVRRRRNGGDPVSITLQGHYGFTRMPFARDIPPQALHPHPSHREAIARTNGASHNASSA